MQATKVSSTMVSLYHSSNLLTANCAQDAVQWLIKNRGGLAMIAGLMMVPSQFGVNSQNSASIISRAVKLNRADFRIEHFEVKVNGDDTINGIIYYPRNWKEDDNSRAVLYHNPNGATVGDYFLDGKLFWTPAEIANLKKRPVIMYDYRGTGLSQDNLSCSSLRFRPTYHSIVVDGIVIQKFALDRFQKVDVWGSSLGGAVATKALHHHLEKYPADIRRVKLKNHDSFTTTSRVVLPQLGKAADWLGWAVGGNLDAEISMKKLINLGVDITVLCHLQDPVIPEGSRMAEFMQRFTSHDNVKIIYSPEFGHAHLSDDMIRKLW